MKGKSVKRADPILVIGFALLFLFQIIGFFSGGMVSLVMGFFVMAGTVIMVIYSIFQMRKLSKCPTCGATRQAREDKFCRICGDAYRK